jgi:hypothetical protein
MAVARLGYEIDSSQAVTAADNLDDMTAAARRAEGGANRLAGATQTVGVRSVLASNGFRNFAQQMNQVGQQTAATGNFMNALAIQLPDILLGFGTLGIAIGAVAPLMVGFVGSLIDATDEAEVFEDRLDSLETVLSSLSDVTDLLELDVVELTQRFGEQSEVVRGLIINLAEFRVSTARDSLREYAELAQIGTERFGRLAESIAANAVEIAELERQGGAFAQVRLDEIAADTARAAESMAEEFGITSDEAIRLSQAFSELNSASTTEDINRELVELNELMDDLGISTEQIPDELEVAIARMSELGILTAELETAMNRVADAAAGVSFGSSLPGLFNQEGGIVLPSEEDLTGGGFRRARGRRGGGRRGGRDEFADDLERLRESLRTETEVVNEWYAEQQAILENQRAMEILGVEQHNELLERLEQEHLDRLSDINQGYQGDRLQQTEQFFGDLASALAGSNARLAAAAQSFAAIESLINAYRAYNQVLADPTLPWFAKIPAAAGVLAAGLRTVSSIRSLGGSGGGGGGTGGGAAGITAESNQQQQQQTRAIIQVQGLGRTRFSVDEINEIIQGIQDASDDGVIIEGVQLT